MQDTKKIFISHVEEDEKIALDIAKGLENAGYETWYYERDSLPGPTYLIQIATAISECSAFVIIISPNSLGSNQVNNEVVSASEKNRPFIPVLYNITHVEFQDRRPDWRLAIGAATSIKIPQTGVADIIPRILAGLRALRIDPSEEMVLIPAGPFLMGDDELDAPVHEVYLDAFYIDKYQVTNAKYKKFMDATGHPAPGYWNNSRFNAPDHPVVGVSWDDANAYCQWAGKRLPTEAEWEKGARGGIAGKKYVWGDEWPPPAGAGNFADKSLKKAEKLYPVIDGYDDGYAYTAPVGKFKPNGYGLYNMAGNVWEWCADWYDRDYYRNSPRENSRGRILVNIVICAAGLGPTSMRTSCARHFVSTRNLPVGSTVWVSVA